MNMQHVQKALRDIDRDGVPRGRRSYGYCLVGNDQRHYPPKLVLSLAHRHMTGTELQACEFHGGPETNLQLIAVGCEIIVCQRKNHQLADQNSSN